MINMTIGGNDYQSIETWEEMPLSKSIELHKIIEGMPKNLAKYYKLASENTIEKGKKERLRDKELKQLEKKISDKERIKEFPQFYGKIICALSNIPEDVMNQIDWRAREKFYKSSYTGSISAESVVYALLFFPYDYKVKGIKKFVFKGQTDWLPKTKRILGQYKPMADSTAVEFAESSDLEIFAKELSGGKYSRMANVISILCRPKVKGQIQKYNEAASLKRAKQFKDLPMSIVWEVFFYAIKHISLSNSSMLMSLVQKELLTLKRKQQAA